MDKPKPNSNKYYEQEIERLKKEVAKLETANKELAAKSEQKPANKRHFFRTLGVTFFITLSIVTFMLFNVANWVKASILDTDGFVSVTQPLIEQPAVQQTLQKEITNALFENIDIETELEQALPENIKFLAGPLTNQVENFTSEKIGELLSSQQFENIWTNTLETVHGTLIEYIQNEENDGVVSINELYVYAGDQLGDSPVSFLLNKQLPDKVGSITIAQVTWLDETRTYVNYIDKLPIVLLATSLLTFLIALALAVNKKNVAITTIVLLLVIMISTTIALVVGREITANQVQPEYSAAASEVYTVVTNPLMARTQGYIALFSIVILLFFLTSGIGFVQKTRQYLKLNINKIISSLTPKFEYPEWLEWFIANREVIAWTAFMLIFAITGLRIPPDYNQVINGFVGGAVFALIYLLVTQILISGKQKLK